MTTSTITWHPATDCPDAETNVLIGLHIDGLRTSTAGFFDGDVWRDSDARSIPESLIVGWAHLPECPL